MTTIRQETIDEFAVRYYGWSLRDAQREVDEGYPILKTVQSSAALGAIDFFESLPHKSRQRQVVALVKRVHKRALEITGEYLTPEEDQLVEYYLSTIMGFFGKHLDRFNLIRFEEGIRTKGIDKKRLRESAVSMLNPICGEVSARHTGYEWSHRMVCEGWQIYTNVEVRGSSFHLKYDQEIRSLQDSGNMLKQGISILGWMGISNTEWDILVGGDEQGAAESVSLVCARFAQAAPGLLSGLL